MAAMGREQPSHEPSVTSLMLRLIKIQSPPRADVPHVGVRGKTPVPRPERSTSFQVCRRYEELVCLGDRDADHPLKNLDSPVGRAGLMLAGRLGVQNLANMLRACFDPGRHGGVGQRPLAMAFGDHQ